MDDGRLGVGGHWSWRWLIEELYKTNFIQINNLENILMPIILRWISTLVHPWKKSLIWSLTFFLVTTEERLPSLQEQVGLPAPLQGNRPRLEYKLGYIDGT